MMTLNILLIEPYYGGSHQAWADGYARHSRHNVTLLTLPAQFWKWRMQGGAVTIARLFNAYNIQPDVILVSDMMDLSTFRALTRKQTSDIPCALYFHENQLVYPQNSRQKHGWQYGFINYISAMAADAVYFNSAFHQRAFYDELPRMLKHFGDYNELESMEQLKAKSSVLPVGINLKRYDIYRPKTRPANASPLILWNHRWEEDKNPRTFFQALYGLMNSGIAFRVAIVGENFRQEPTEFEEARQRLGDRVVRYGFVEEFAEYARLLWQADYIISTAYQDFFGISVAEAIYCGCIPILPGRLNYPALMPEAYHDDCLYRGNALQPLLIKHLTGDIAVDTIPLQRFISQFEWQHIAPQYDAAFSQLIQTR
ncbi:MAG: DUF3524 domain-containing protein [Chloroflexi bacterium]|nr:MAG: DUF3524 domain-containing protein [Phototrophicales bacterium]RMF81936.1 MAG: DUF3524 domain-containing protein [Chloroflexota bacterium]